MRACGPAENVGRGTTGGGSDTGIQRSPGAHAIQGTSGARQQCAPAENTAIRFRRPAGIL